MRDMGMDDNSIDLHRDDLRTKRSAGGSSTACTAVPSIVLCGAVVHIPCERCGQFAGALCPASRLCYTSCKALCCGCCTAGAVDYSTAPAAVTQVPPYHVGARRYMHGCGSQVAVPGVSGHAGDLAVGLTGRPDGPGLTQGRVEYLLAYLHT